MMLYSVYSCIYFLKKHCIVLYEMLHSFGIQHDTTQYNKESCMLLYEMLYSLERGLSSLLSLVTNLISARRIFRSKELILVRAAVYPDTYNHQVKVE